MGCHVSGCRARTACSIDRHINGLSMFEVYDEYAGKVLERASGRIRVSILYVSPWEWPGASGRRYFDSVRRVVWARYNTSVERSRQEPMERLQADDSKEEMYDRWHDIYVARDLCFVHTMSLQSMRLVSQLTSLQLASSSLLRRLLLRRVEGDPVSIWSSTNR